MKNNNDIISREALKEYVKKVEDYESAYTICGYIDEAPAVNPCNNCDLYFKAMTKEKMRKGPQGEITNDDIQQAIKEGFANGYEMAKAKLVKKLNDRVEKSVCMYCQMNKHCELCEISRVFSIIALTDKEMKEGAE